jgi:hypothetical protein
MSRAYVARRCWRFVATLPWLYLRSAVAGTISRQNQYPHHHLCISRPCMPQQAAVQHLQVRLEQQWWVGGSLLAGIQQMRFRAETCFRCILPFTLCTLCTCVNLSSCKASAWSHGSRPSRGTAVGCAVPLRLYEQICTSTTHLTSNFYMLLAVILHHIITITCQKLHAGGSI